MPIGRLWPAAAATARSAPRRDAVRPDPRDLRRALPRRSRACGAGTAPGSSSFAPPTSCSRSPRRPRRDAVERLHIPDERIVVVGAAASASYARPARDRRGARRGARGGARARAALRALHGRDGRPEELPGPVPRVGPPARGGPRRVAARDGVQHGRPDAQPPRAPRARGRHRVAAAAARASSPTRCCACSTSRPTCSCSRRSTRATGCRSPKRSRAVRATIGSSTSSVARAARARGAVRSRRRRRDGRRDRARRSPTTRRGRCSTSRPAGRCPDGTHVADRVAERRTSGCSRGRGRAARRRPLVAVVTPLPPAASGVADYSYRLLEALREHCDVHAFADGRRRVDPELGPPRAPDGVEVLPVRHLVEQERGTRRLRLRRLLPRQQRVPRAARSRSCGAGRASCSRTKCGSPTSTR